MKNNEIPNQIEDPLAARDKDGGRRRQLEQLLDEIENIYEKVWKSSLAGIYISQEGLFQAISPHAASYTGYLPDELVGQRSDSLILPEDLDNVKASAREMLAGRRSSPYEFRIITKQGDVCWVMETVAPAVFKGKPAILGNSMDITERKAVEDRLRESENLYRAIFETTGAATIIIDDDMTITLINSEFEKMTGYKREEWEGKRKWPDYIPKKDLRRMINTHKLRRVDADAAPRNFEHDLIDSEGRIRNMFLTADLIPGTKKSVVSFMDISAWKEAEKGLKKREEELRIKSRNLEELNTALRVLLSQRENDRKELEENVLANVKEFVLPYVEEIKNSQIDDKARAYADILLSNLQDIISPFSRKLSSKYINLTPKEIEVANFIKEGKTSKEIADIMNVSKSAVDIHRYRLRNKLGLNKRKANLRSHLSQYF